VKRELLTAVALREQLHYEPETGVFTRKVKTSNVFVGDVAGSLNVHGYIHIRVCGADCLAHRLAWLYVHGEWPKQQIDHINGIKTDNRIANLRDASPAMNTQNIKAARVDSRSGVLGVQRHGRRWRARISLGDSRLTALGQFDTPEEAYAAYVEAKRRMHEGCTL
jgi:hypothetical protein